MNQIDLIPQEYRQWREHLRGLSRFAIVLACVVIALVAVGMYVSRQTAITEARIARLQSRSAVTQEQRTQLESLDAQQNEYERQWSLLRGLRAGAGAEDIFTIVDRALNGNDLWFLSWQFRRAGVIVEAGERGVETGYFIVIPENQRSNGQSEWQVETHMTIEGQARDHQALSTFVRALFEQPEIRDVSVRKTSRTDYGSSRVVSFDLTVVLNSALRES